MGNRPVDYLSYEDLLAAHAAIMWLGGWQPQAVRAPCELESAIHPARTAAYYGGADLVGQAARLATGISRAQALVDGNKRTAFAAADAFLRLNGHAIRARAEEFGEALIQATDPGVSPDVADAEFEEWLRGHIQPLD